MSDRPPVQSWYLDHDILPQEILERGPEIQERFDIMGTRTCAGCRRLLHQDSFRDSFARQWTLRLGEHGRMCYTCSEAQRLREQKRPKISLSTTQNLRDVSSDTTSGVE